MGRVAEENELRHHWGDAYHITYERGVWTARGRGLRHAGMCCMICGC
jgi:hypothetical protein